MNLRKIVIAITGASGSIYARMLFNELSKLNLSSFRIDAVITQNAKEVWRYELGEEFVAPPYVTLYDLKDFNAPFASGSSGYEAMIIIPCSMGTLGRIASGISDDLITRSADVMLKERKKLILVCRETPLNLIHLNNMQAITQAGAVICPACPSFYSKPQSLSDAVLTVVHRVMKLVNLEVNSFEWGSS